MSNADTLRQLHQDHLSNYNTQEQQAIELMGLLNKLYNEQDVQVTLFGETLDTSSVGQILALHQKVALREQGAKTIQVADTLAMVKTLAENKGIQAARIDVGQLIASDTDVQAALQAVNQEQGAMNSATDVVIRFWPYRILTRLLLSQASCGKACAIVVRPAQAISQACVVRCPWQFCWRRDGYDKQRPDHQWSLCGHANDQHHRLYCLWHR